MLVARKRRIYLELEKNRRRTKVRMSQAGKVRMNGDDLVSC